VISMGALRDWTPVFVAIGALLSPLLFVRWIPQLGGRVAGAKTKVALLILGIGITTFCMFSIYAEHRDICSPERNDGINCDVSDSLLIVALCWISLVALSQIRFVITAFKAVMTPTRRWRADLPLAGGGEDSPKG
jgi:hypothetical protein